ncbi:multifunctional transcriptional regulator/nicotinamide-nucleotide adenylyltransferase/ribosylnicotinamide kinase NadR [Niallia endozanthoxylica]|uniref:Multifunctional transcriptional regulator/nicotinamide-nucleotide adenylyltransferase/ribosylnicotinamide kinase NadR n=1 Tax=Niallia endozanthoxylica TaxID=2036016 RepID=A0A5J5HTU5_9BACI|nr:multifunctional transcriptional regulator/nicotinamide-nucleotide adenylyltransferase/ribosylnicotinamide kinase NadR [Niallia endozanthoxylica]KAA9023817.1 multifunctional transcriptional regulator/nicotinamide-nucleotide adenylyltransferase/ribosylnicotinamide kinase NadR [Niallia endozanthoxylica]
MTVGFIGGKFLPLHLGHVYSITKAACMVDELFVILSHSEKRDRSLCDNSKVDYISAQVRLRWLSQLTKDMENVHVLSIKDEAENEEEYDWAQGGMAIRNTIGKPIDIVFSSETAYTPIFKQIYPNSEHILLDETRRKIPISATRIRKEGPFIHWNYIPDVVKPYFVKKIVIVGTESCGKSTLTRYLAKLFNTTVVEEYGRMVCDELGGCDGLLLPEDFQRIAYGHKLLEHQAIQKANKVVFIDTEAMITQYYSKLYCNQEQKVLDEIGDLQDYDLWLLLEPDVKWVDDGLRVHGEQTIRENNHLELKRMLDRKGILYQEIKGNYYERLDRAIKLVNTLVS